MFGRKKENTEDSSTRIENNEDPTMKDAVLEALKAVMDPDLGRNIVELGFVQNVRTCDGHVAFKVELTTPACPVKDQMKKQCEDIVSALPGVKNVAVEMTAQTRAVRPPEIRNLIPGIQNAIAVASGKGGVGKSTTAVNLALALAESGAKVGLMDADVYGPSIPIMLGVPEGEQPQVVHDEAGVQRIVPIERFGIKLISIGFLTEKSNPIVWRGPMVGKMIQQFLGAVQWGELDYLVIDLPPGTGDAQLTLIQSAPLSGAVIVTTPEAVAGEDVIRAGHMFTKMASQGLNVPILGIVENMSWFETPSGERIELFGHGGGERAAKEFDAPLLGQVPRVLEITHGGDNGTPIFAADPHHPVSNTYREIAGGVARRISTLALKDKVFRTPTANAPGLLPMAK